MSSRDDYLGTAMTTGWSVAGKLPEAVADRIFQLAATGIYRRRGGAVIQLAKNLRRVLPATATPETLAATVEAGVRSYARYWKETCRLDGMDIDTVYRRALSGTTGMDAVERAHAEGRGMIVALPHSGNWDIAGLMVSRHLGAITTVAERLRPDAMYRRFLAHRESLGMEVLPLTGGDAPVSGILKDRLRAGGIVCLIADRDLTRSGIPVTFFGEETRMPAGPAMLAALTGAELRAVHLSYTERDGSTPQGWRQVIGPAIDLTGDRLRDTVYRATQMMADQFAVHIARHPADWHMMQPFWIADLPAAERRELSGAPMHRGAR
jgi:lauroyl/myristoyl acyltransferase